MVAIDDAVAAMANAFATDGNLHSDVTDNLGAVTALAYKDNGMPAAGFHAMRTILQGVLDYFGLEGKLVPPKGIVPFNLSAADVTNNFTAGLGDAGKPYAGWAICDGANGTPDLRNKFIRSTDGAAGGTGGSDTHDHTIAHTHSHSHTHTIAHTHTYAHSHGMPSHAHLIPFGFDGGTIYYTGNASDLPLYGSTTITERRATAVKGAESSAATRVAFTEPTDPGTTNTQSTSTTGGSSAANSGAASTPTTGGSSAANSGSGSTLPAYHQLTYLMRV